MTSPMPLPLTETPLPLTGSQTVGPFFSIGLSHLQSQQVPALPAQAIGHASSAPPIEIEGAILDAQGAPVVDALLEIWQADADGRYAQDVDVLDMGAAGQFPGFARVAASPEGTFRFVTTRPGPVVYDRERMQAPHLLVLIFMRGLLRNLVTRMYFPDAAANDADPVLALVPADRRHTLIAQPTAAGKLRWTILLRGDATQETVFFAW